MERLTKRDEFGNADIIGVDSADLQLNLEFDDLNRVTDALNRLAAYEDTGMEPKEVKAKCAWADNVCKMLSGIFEDSGVFDFSHIKELITAEQEDRLVVLPCRVGDTVYIVDRGKILEEEVIGFSTFNTKSGETVTAMTASYGYYVTRPNINDLGVLHSGNRLSFFFTRAEAEKAMKGVSEDTRKN